MTDLQRKIAIFLIDISPLTALNKGNEEQSKLELNVLTACLELYYKLEEENKTDGN